MSARTPVRVRLAAAIAAVAAACASASAAADREPSPSPFDQCRPSGAARSYDDLLCVYRAGVSMGSPAEARRHLLRSGRPSAARPWLTLVFGHLAAIDDEQAAPDLYATAAAGFVQSGEAEGEVIARQNLRILYRRHGDPAAAARQVALATAAAERSGLPFVIARAAVMEASDLVESGGDVGRARQALVRAERLVFPAGPIGLRRAILFQLGTTNLYLGLFDDAIEALERHRALRREDGSAVDAAAVAFNLLNARVTRDEARPSEAAREELVRRADATLAEVRTLGRPYIEAHTLRMLADLQRPSDAEGAAAHLRECLAIERPLGYPQVRAACLWSLARIEAGRDPAEADRLSREALALAGGEGAGPMLAYAWQARLRLVWRTLGERDAIAESMAALDAIERLRAAQADAQSRAGLFGGWTADYYWLTGRLLQSAPDQVATAFEVGERLRTRVLLDRLAAEGAGAPPSPAGRSVAAIERSLVATQRALLAAGSARERQALSDRLTLLEFERREAGGDDVPAAAGDAVSFASLAAVRRALGPDEAMVWFSLAPWTSLYGEFAGGAWVLVITRDGVHVERLDGAEVLDGRVAAMNGLLRQRRLASHAWAPAARRLGTELLGRALDAVPAGTTRLVVVSDGPLHALPFEALQTGNDPRPIGERFALAVVPSATLWLRLRQSAAPGGSPALVLADPDVAGADAGASLPPLPGARREARTIAAALGLAPLAVHLGADASERALKQARGAAILHLAAHARADERYPERSAVFLAPGAADEDGWLQPREIARLPLTGALVVLSACESADGPLVSGEGPLSMARAFFAGGAAAVVATRWPVRDDDAAFMMAAFYRELASGAAAASALRSARMAAVDAGIPAEAWAGFALLGDGALTRDRVARQAAWPAWWAVPAAFVPVALLGGRQRRRGRATVRDAA